MTREELIKKVALKMDEVSSSDDVIVSVGIDDNNPLYTQIDSLLNESVNEVLIKAPIYRIASLVKTMISPNVFPIHPTNRQRVEFDVPDKFLRLVSIFEDTFQRPIVELAIEGDEIAKRQHNKHLMAKSAKPVAVLGRDNMGKRIITCYSFGPNDDPQTVMSYLERFEGIDKNASVELDDYLINIVTWACAGKVFAAQGDTVKAQTCDTNAAALMV